MIENEQKINNQHVELLNQVTQLEFKVAQLKDLNNDYDNAMKQMQEEHEAEIMLLGAEKSEGGKDKSYYDQKIEIEQKKFKKAIESQKSKLKEANELNVDLQRRYRKFRTENTNAKQDLIAINRELEKQLKEMEERHRYYNKQIEALNSQSSTSVEGNQQRIEMITALNNARIENEQKANGYLEIIKSHEEQLKNAYAYYEFAEKNKAIMEASINNLNNTNSVLKSQFESSENLARILKNTVLEKTQEHDLEKEFLRQQFEGLKAFTQKMYEEANVAVNARIEEKLKLEAQIVSLVATIASKDGEYASLYRQLAEHQQALIQGETQHRLLFEAFKQNHQYTTTQSEEMAQLKAQNQRHYEGIQMLNHQLATQLNENQNYQNQATSFQNIQRVFEQAKHDADSAELRLQLAQEEIAKYQNEQTWYKNKIQNQSKIIKSKALQKKKLMGEWKKARLELNPSWKDVYAKVHVPGGPIGAVQGDIENEVFTSELIFVLEKMVERLSNLGFDQMNRTWGNALKSQPHDVIWLMTVAIFNSHENSEKDPNAHLQYFINELKKSGEVLHEISLPSGDIVY